MRIIIYLTLIISALSCRLTKDHQIIVDQEKITEVIEKEILVPQLIETVITEPCDSNGNLIPFKKEISTGTTKVVLSATDSGINFNYQSKPDTLFDFFLSRDKQHIIYKDKKVFVTKTPQWAWWSLLINIILLGFISRKLWL